MIPLNINFVKRIETIRIEIHIEGRIEILRLK